MAPATRRSAPARLGAALGAALALAGCGKGDRPARRELEGLVTSASEVPRAINVATLTDAAELQRAAALSHAAAAAALGPHVTEVRNTTTLAEVGGSAEPPLEITTVVELGPDGAFHALSNNSADYGEEITFVGGQVYLRPRYARWHRRPPTAPEEPLQLRDRLLGELAATLELVAPGMTITAGPDSTVAGRPAKAFALARAASPRAPAAEKLSQRAWRTSRAVEKLDGQVFVDAATGVVLGAKLAATLTFSRDGRTFSMAIDVTHQVRDVGRAPPIAPPPPEETVATPTRTGEVAERDRLLEGLAPAIGTVPTTPGGGPPPPPPPTTTPAPTTPKPPDKPPAPGSGAP
jgi:hypothetical protein